VSKEEKSPDKTKDSINITSEAREIRTGFGTSLRAERSAEEGRDDDVHADV